MNAAPTDLTAALAFLRSDGPTRVALIGASVGGTASLVVASEQQDVPAVITLSAPEVLDSLAAGPDVLTNITGAKLFIAGLGDPSGAAGAGTAERFFRSAAVGTRMRRGSAFVDCSCATSPFIHSRSRSSSRRLSVRAARTTRRMSQMMKTRKTSPGPQSKPNASPAATAITALPAFPACRRR